MLEFSETLKLIQKAQTGDEYSKEKLVVENSPLIKSVIKRYKSKGIDYEDLYQLGSLGFLKAIENFDASYNVKFSTYAVPMIAGEVKRFLRDNGIIKISRSVKAMGILINKYVDQYNNDNLQSPTIEEIAEKFDISTQDAVFAMESSRAPISLYSHVGSDDENRQQVLIDKIPNNNPLDAVMDNFTLMKIISTLPPRDKKIILLRYFRDKTQSEIAKDLGVSQVQVSRLETKIIQAIRERIVE